MLINMQDLVEIEGEGIVYWPMCPIAGCQNRISLALKSKYCYPHTKSGDTFDDLMDSLSSEKLHAN